MFDLTGKVAIVTGGNGGIGLGMARGLAQAGAKIAIFARNGEKNSSASAELKALGAEVDTFEVDVTNSEIIAAAVNGVVNRFGRLDILVNNAGTNRGGRPEDLSEDDWHFVLDTNVTSAFLCSKACYPKLKEGGGGKILNCGSMYSLFASPRVPAYAASKGAIVQLTKSLATAWAKDNIQVNCFLPGWVETDLTARAREQVPALHESVLNRTPAHRWGKPEDLAGVAVFLASSASDFVTGASIPVDGGYSIVG